MRKSEKEAILAISFREKMPVIEILLNKDGSAEPLCPRCKTPLDREFMSFCDSCGQRLDWHGFSFAKAIIFLQ